MWTMEGMCFRIIGNKARCICKHVCISMIYLLQLVGAPCGQHGQYTFYKALRITGERERIIAIGDFFFVRIWQDSELVSIGKANCFTGQRPCCLS